MTSPVQAGADAGLALARSIAGQPFMAGLIVVQIVLLLAVYGIAREERIGRHKEMQLMLERCMPAPR